MTLVKAIAEEGTEAVQAGRGYIQWKGHPDYGLYLEVGDGQDYTEPFDSVLAAALARQGWRLPQDDIRNCWFEMPLAPGESENSLAYRIRTVAEMVGAASQALLQWDGRP
jgi:hypothetical protein